MRDKLRGGFQRGAKASYLSGLFLRWCFIKHTAVVSLSSTVQQPHSGVETPRRDILDQVGTGSVQRGWRGGRWGRQGPGSSELKKAAFPGVTGTGGRRLARAIEGVQGNLEAFHSQQITSVL